MSDLEPTPLGDFHGAFTLSAEALIAGSIDLTPRFTGLHISGTPAVVLNQAEGHVDLVYDDGTMRVRLEDSVVRLLVATILATDPA